MKSVANLLPTATSEYRNMIQINIFDATTQDLRASGLDLEKCLDMLGFRSVLMDIVIPPTDSSGLPTEPFDPPPNTANSPTEPLDCSEVDNNETVQVEKVKRKGRRRSATQARKKGVRRMTKPRKNKLDKPIKSRTSNPKSSCELCRDHIYAVEDSIPSIHGDSATEGCQVVPQRHEPDVAIHKRKRRRISSKSGTVEAADTNSARLDEPVIVNCFFPNCKKRTLRWKRSRGIRDLKDHARTHWGKPVLNCQHCEAVLLSSNQYYNHYKKHHQGEKHQKPNLLGTEQDREELRAIWEQCFTGIAFR